MSTTVMQKGGDFELPPAGTHRARCYRVVDLGTQNITWQGQTKWAAKVLIGWELSDELMDDGKPFTVAQRFTASLSDKANLRHMLESYRGKPFTAVELEGFSLKKVLGAPCLLTVAHEPSKDGKKTYANVKAVTPLAKGMQPPGELKNPKIHFEIEEGEQSQTFKDFPEWLQKVILACKEWNSPAEQHAPEQPEGGHGEEQDDSSLIPF